MVVDLSEINRWFTVSLDDAYAALLSITHYVLGAFVDACFHVIEAWVGVLAVFGLL
jgi:hypothetical protein